MKDKLSVIVPVYNVEKYLNKCLESLINQTYKNLEIVVVEDCSKDNSKKLLENYKKYKNIKFIYNKKNSGLSFSRNVGIENSTGDYIGFVDSDDYVDLDYYEKMMDSIIKNKSDIVLSDIKSVYEATGDVLINKACIGNVTKENILKSGLSASCANKVFKKDIIKEYPFEVGKINEDLAVVIPCLVKTKNISYVENTYYYYIQRENSIQNSKFNPKKFDIFWGVELTLERIKNEANYEDLKDTIIYNQIITFLLYYITSQKKFFTRLSILRKYHKLAKKYNIDKNKYFIEFLSKTDGKHSKYYKMLVKLNAKGLIFLDNLLISFYNLLSKLLIKKIKDLDKINLEDVIKSAKKQSSMDTPSIKLSVVVPNYNYAKFMYQRIYSILNQDYKIYELIILDDKSKDNSKEIIDEIYNKIKDYVNVRVIYNKENSGSAFKQWKKGFDEAKGDYIWIAEADDYCKPNMISSLIKPILSNDKIMISYCDTSFINSTGTIIIKSIKGEIDYQKSGHWDSSYIVNGLDEIKDYSYLNNTIANVSSTIIKNGNYEEIFNSAGKYKQAGDWLTYVEIMAKGDISYNSEAMNYYRVHGNNVSSTTKYQSHLDELKTLYDYYIKKYNLDDSHKKKIEERINYLKKEWKI